MLWRAAAFGFALLLWGCTDRIMLYDAVDASAPDLIPDLLSGPDIPRDGICPSKHLNYTQPPAPRLVILLDRSSSMQESFGNTTRELAAQSALLEAIAEYQAKVEFGFAQFPADSADPSWYDCMRGYCCAGPVEPWPATKNYDRMRDAIECSAQRPCPIPSDGSSSSAALLQAKEFFSKSRSDIGRFALLVTASEPSCMVPSGVDACESAVDAARALYSMGISLGVLAVGYDPGPKSCLTQISQSGDVVLPSPMTTKDLSSAVDDLMWRVASPSCTVELDYAPPVQPVVSLDQHQLLEDEENGWSFTNYARTSLTLAGSACSEYLRSSSKLYISYCPP